MMMMITMMMMMVVVVMMMMMMMIMMMMMMMVVVMMMMVVVVMTTTTMMMMMMTSVAGRRKFRHRKPSNSYERRRTQNVVQTRQVSWSSGCSVAVITIQVDALPCERSISMEFGVSQMLHILLRYRVRRRRDVVCCHGNGYSRCVVKFSE